MCLDWIDNFWDFLTVGENGPATRVDFQRFFNYMDNDGDYTYKAFVEMGSIFIYKIKAISINYCNLLSLILLKIG